VTVTLTSTDGFAGSTTTTDSNGNFSFTGLTPGGSFTITPSGGGFTFDPESRTFNRLTTNITNANFLGFFGQGQGCTPAPFPSTLGCLEGDVATRFLGDGLYRSNDVEQERRFVAGIDQPNPATNEFQRADVAPYETRGDGRLRADDFQVVMNYVAGLVAPQTAGGPTQPIAGTALLAERDAADAKATGRAMRIVSDDAPSGKAAVTVEIDSLGDETVALFTLNFDSSKLSNPAVSLGEEMPEGITLTSNTRNASDGYVTVLLDSATLFNRGFSTRVVTVTFDVVKGAAPGEAAITFDGSGSLSDAQAVSLNAVYHDGIVMIGKPSLVDLNYESRITNYGWPSINRPIP